MNHPTFLFGCFQQPITYFAVWKARNCSYVVGPELGNPPVTNVKDWCKAAADNGLQVVGNKFLLAENFRPPNLLAWYLDDEPNEPNHNTPIEQISKQAADFRRIDATIPVWLNLGGDRLTGPPSAIERPKYVQMARTADRLSYDWYVKNREYARYPLYFNGQCLNYLSSVGAKFLGAMAECSWQKLNNSDPRGRCPTPDEFEAQVLHMVANGATAITYFSTAERTSWPQAYDTTPPEISSVMTKLNRKVIDWAEGIITGPITSQRKLTLTLGTETLFQKDL